MDRSTDPGRAPECFEFDSSDKTNTVVTLREGFTLTLFSPPIGFIYVQFPGKPNPATLGLPGTWTNISSQFAGDFFRAEGGNASAFESGRQTSQNLSHSHGAATGGMSANDPHRHGYKKGGSLTPGGQARDTPEYQGTNYTDYASIAHTHAIGADGGTEARPTNRTVRIWERTA